MISLHPSRRGFIQGAAAAGAAMAFSRPARAEAPVRGGQVILGQYPEPPVLTSAITTAGPTQQVSGKIFDGLIKVGLDGSPQPHLALGWDVAADGLAITFRLRPGVTWHNGQPFTSQDVAFSVLEIWKKFHSRGRSTFANVEAVETPDPLTVIWRLSRPAPYIISALASIESQVIPRHLYAGTDILTNPHNTAPVGTGPFRFAAWERGNYIVLERNPTYWDQPKPYLDRVIFRILPDPAANMNALETGEVQVISSNILVNDIDRLKQNPEIEVVLRGSSYSSGVSAIDFNLDRPVFQDLRVRQAIAHAIDKDFISQTIQRGYGKAVHGPIPPEMAGFYTPDVPLYPYDPKRAEELLDAAGYPRRGDGMRFEISHDPAPTGPFYLRSAEYLRDALGRVGIKVTIRTQDFASFTRRVYTERDFDTIHYGAGTGPDPAIGTQRFYWSKNFAPGVVFSNAAHYSNPEVDRLLETAQMELNVEKRRDLYIAFQKLVQADLPRIPTLTLQTVILKRRNVRDIINSGESLGGNFAAAYIA